MPIKGAQSLFPLAFYLAVTVVNMSQSMSNGELSKAKKQLSKTIGQLAKSIKSIQDEILALKCRPTHSSLDPLSKSSSQDNSTRNEPGHKPPSC